MTLDKNASGLSVNRNRNVAALLLWIMPVLFLLLFYFYPLGSIIHLVLGESVNEGTESINWFSIWKPITFTFWQAILSTMATLIIGLPAAYVFARYKFLGKRFIRILTTIPFILPTVVVAAAFNTLLGPRGWVNIILMDIFNLAAPPINIMNTLSAIIIAHVFYNTTIMIRIIGSAWVQVDPKIESASRVLGASPLKTLWEITLPLLKHSILAASLLVFLFDFTSFGVVLILGGPQFATLEVEIYIQSLYMLNLKLAGILSMIQLIFTLLFTVLYSRILGSKSIPIAPSMKGEGVSKPDTNRERLLIIIVNVALIILLILPILSLGARSIIKLDADRGERGEIQTGLTFSYYKELFINRRQSLFYVPPIDAIRNSIIYASLTVIISITLGIMTARALTKQLWINRVLDPILLLPLGTSAVTLGLGYILIYSKLNFNNISFPWIIPVAHSLVALPFVVRTIQPALSSIPANLKEAAAVLGASPRKVWKEIEFPIILRSVMAAAIFSFVISLGEFSATMFLTRPEYPTIPVAIYRFISQPGQLNYGQALAMSTILMVVCAFSILLIEQFEPEDN